MSEEKSQVFFVEGMHCASCVFFIEEALPGSCGVTRAKVDLARNTAEIFGDLSDTPEHLAEKLTAIIAENGYRLSLATPQRGAAYREFLVAVPAAGAFIVAFFVLQQFGFVRLIGSGDVTFLTALFIGLIASVSTCLAVVGGLVLSLSARAAQRGERSRAQVFFHLGRLGGFFVLGGVIGALGKVFQLGIMGTGILGLGIALIMLVLGVNLLDIFPGTHRLLPKMPRIFTRYTGALSTSSHVLAPLVVGVGTFFLPCGFTQSMQFYALTTGSFFTGAYIMFFFALGTFPVLAALSFGAFKIAHQPWKGVFFKAAGIVVIALALFNALHVLAALGLLSPFLSF